CPSRPLFYHGEHRTAGNSARESLDHRPGQQRHHDLVVARDLVADTAAATRRTLHDIHAGAVVLHHVEVCRDELAWHTFIYVAAHGQRLEEDFGHDDSRAEVQHDAVFDGGQVCGEAAEVAYAGGADRGAV